MGLSNDLISQFVKLTKTEKNTKAESTHNGTIVTYNGNKYVQLDGSDLLTPVNTTADTKNGDRVTVMIKNHSATVTGNITSPSARTEDLQETSGKVSGWDSRITEVEILVADKVSTSELEAESARIDELVADNIIVKDTVTANKVIVDEIKAENVVISERLDAVDAFIENLDTDFLTAEAADIRYATIESLNATNSSVYNLEVVYGEFEDLSTRKFEAYDATINSLDSTYAAIDDLNAERARIDVLEAGQLGADSAVIKNLQSGIADINTLIFGSATGDVIQTSFANSVIAQLGNAQIKSAMIESVSADKITAGDIITNNVRVMSEDGKLLISDETIQISDETRVRVQVGKDSSGDYSINIWDADGKLMFSEGGITDSAIKEAIIRDDMVSDTANISAHKLNIESLFEEINGSAQTIKSSKIMMDVEGQTLDVIFTDMTTDMSILTETVNTHGTQLSVVQGEISSKVWQQDITSAIDNIEVGGRNLFGFHKGVGVGPVLSTVSTVTKNESTYGVTATVIAEYNGNLLRLGDLGFDVVDLGKEPFTFSALAYASIDDCEIGMDICDTQIHRFILNTTPQKISFTSYPSSYCTADNTYYNGFVDLSGKTLPVGTVIYLEKIKIERGTKVTDFTVAPEDLEYVTDNLETKTSTLTTQYSSLDQTVDGISATVANHTSELSGKANESEVVAVEDNVAQLTLTVNEFKTEVGNTYATKGDLSGVNDRVITNKSAIEQNADDITLVVNRATNNEQAISTLQQTSSSLTSRIKTTEDDVKTNTSLITTAQTTADNAQTTATNAQSDIDNLEVGARNLARNTSNAIGYTVTTETGTDAYSICDSYVKHGIFLEQGKTYTLSYDYEFDWGSVTKPTSAVGVGAGIGSDDGQNLPGSYYADTFNMVADYWIYGDGGYDSGRFVYTFTNNTTKDLYFAFRMIRSYKYGATLDITGVSITVSNFKVEIGNRATDWSPAPEDMATSDQLATVQSSAELTEERVTTAETLIQQLSDSISMLVTDGNGESLMTQTATGWTFSTGELQDIVDATSKNLDDLTNEVGDVNSTIDVLQQTVDDLGLLNDYVKIGTYENEPCIELGESDSDFKLLITNTRIMFMEGSSVPAYINNQSLYIEKAVIEEELQQGEFVWKARSNGNLGLIWKGVSS